MRIVMKSIMKGLSAQSRDLLVFYTRIYGNFSLSFDRENKYRLLNSCSVLAAEMINVGNLSFT